MTLADKLVKMQPGEIIEIEDVEGIVHTLQCHDGKPTWLPNWCWPRPRFAEICDYFLRTRRVEQ